MAEELGATLVWLRQRKGYTQLGVAEGFCAASGLPTVTRQLVSRWEREECVPNAFWLGWLAVVLEVPLKDLVAARPCCWHRKWISTDMATRPA